MQAVRNRREWSQGCNGSIHCHFQGIYLVTIYIFYAYSVSSMLPNRISSSFSSTPLQTSTTDFEHRQSIVGIPLLRMRLLPMIVPETVDPAGSRNPTLQGAGWSIYHQCPIVLLKNGDSHFSRTHLYRRYRTMMYDPMTSTAFHLSRFESYGSS